MNQSITAALALLVTMGGVRAGAETMRAEVEPQLQISRLAGTIEVETPGRKESVSGQKLPYIRSGSIVRVVSGAAEFRSDLGAVVSAGKGDAFHFSAQKPASGRRGSMSIMAVETDPKELEVVVGDEVFQLARGGRLAISSDGRDEVTVVSDRGEAKIAARASNKDGAMRPTARMMSPGESLIIPVPADPRYAGSAMSLTGVTVSRKNATTFTAQGEGRPETRQANADEARGAIAGWPAESKRVAEAMIEKYGAPSAAGAGTLTWRDNGSWKRTTVYRDPSASGDVLEQTLGYEVSPDQAMDLAKIDAKLRVDRAAGELSATSESEETNFLAMNLADEVVREKRTVEDAREFYQSTVKLSRAGKSSPYMRELMFQP